MFVVHFLSVIKHLNKPPLVASKAERPLIPGLQSVSILAAEHCYDNENINSLVKLYLLKHSKPTQVVCFLAQASMLICLPTLKSQKENLPLL